MIKKRLLPILMLLIFAMAFAGCDREAVSLGIELKSVNSWKATETQGTMVYAITHNNQTISVTMDYDKYSEMATQTAEIMVNIKSISPPHLFVFMGPHPWHTKVLRLRVKSELQQLAYTTATATWDLSRLCDLHHSSRQLWVLTH